MSHNLKRSLKGPVGNKGHHAWDNVTGQIVQVLDKCAGQGDISQILQVYNKPLHIGIKSRYLGSNGATTGTGTYL